MRDVQAAELLLRAWRNPAFLLDELPEKLAPLDWAEAHAIQDRLLEQIGPIGGYKVGAAGAMAPISFAPLPESGILNSGTTLVGFHQRWVEAEIAVVISRDLPLREHSYSDEEVGAAIGSVHPVIEVLNSRFRDTTKIDTLSLGADLIMHGALIVGEATTMPDLIHERVSVMIDGTEASHGQGHPARDLPRLLRHLADHVGLREGQIITTGSWNPITVAPENGTVGVKFSRAGSVTVQFSKA